MKRSLLIAVSVVFLLVSAACSNPSGGGAGKPEKLQVDINPVQQVLIPGRAVLIDARLSNDAGPIKEGADVQIEIWKNGSAKHETIAATPLQDGTYRIRTLFAEGGEYTVKARVKHEKETVTTSEKKLFVQRNEIG